MPKKTKPSDEMRVSVNGVDVRRVLNVDAPELPFDDGEG